MKKFLSLLLTVLIMANCMGPVMAADNSDIIFFDDFSSDTSATYITNGPTVTWSQSDSTLSMVGSSWKSVDKAFSADNKNSGKVVIEFGVKSTTSNKGFNFGVKVNGAITYSADIKNTSNTVLYAWIDKDAGTYTVYDAEGNVKSSPVSVTANMPVQGFSMNMATSSEIVFNYIKAYELDENPIVIDSDKTELDKIDVIFNLPFDTSLQLENYLSLENGEISAVSVVNEAKKHYRIAFSQAMDYEEANKIILTDIPLIIGGTGSGESAFSTRGKVLRIDVSFEEETLVTGTKDIYLDILNEFDSYEDAVLVAAVYYGDGSMDLFPFDITTQTISTSMEITVGAVDGQTRLELYVVDNMEDMNFLTEKTTYTASGSTKSVVTYEDGITSSITSYTLDPSENTGVFEISLNEATEDTFVYVKIFDDEENLIYFLHTLTENLTKEFIVKFPLSDTMEEYTIEWGPSAVGDEDIPSPFVFEFFPEGYVNECFNFLRTVELKAEEEYLDTDINWLIGFTGSYGIKLNYTPQQIRQIFVSTIALRVEKDGFVNKDDAIENVRLAIDLTINLRNNSEEFIETAKTKGYIDPVSYDLYKNSFTEEMKNGLISDFGVAKVYNLSQLEELMNNSVVMNGILKATHYMQVRTVLTEMETTIDPSGEIYEVYVDLDEDKKIEIENDLIHSGATSIEDLRGFFSQYVNAANTPEPPTEPDEPSTPSRPSSPGKGGSVGGTFSNDYEPKKEENEEVKEENKEENTNEKVIAFNDIDNHIWAKEAIYELAKMNVINGKAENEFCPDDFISRKEIAKIIAISFDLESETNTPGFNDVDASDWSAPYIAAVSENGIITGVDNAVFMPNGLVTREMIATIIYRVLVKNGVAFADSDATFDDEILISDYAKEAVKALSAVGIVNGTGNGKFEPKKTCTRAEAATMIYRALQLYGKE